MLPTIIERSPRGEYALDPYSKLLAERVIFLGTPVDDRAANDVMAQLLWLDYDNPDRDIALYINSPGGSLTAMTAIYDTMRLVGADIQTVCLGQAVSAAAVLLAAGTAGKRLILPHARVVVHQPSIDVSEGQASDLAIRAREMGRLRAAMEEILVEYTRRTPDQVRADLDRETVLAGVDAIGYGYADLLTPARDRRQLARAN